MKDRIARGEEQMYLFELETDLEHAIDVFEGDMEMEDLLVGLQGVLEAYIDLRTKS